MIKINYMDSNSGEPICFDYSFYLKDYIPNKYFDICEDEANAEILYFVDLFHKHHILDNRKENRTVVLDETYFACNYKGTEFTMHHDGAWDIVNFSVSNKEKREEIAEYILKIIEIETQEI